MEIINPLEQGRCEVERVNEGTQSSFYVECSDFSNQLPVLTGPFMTTSEGAIKVWNDMWEGRLK